MPAPGRDLTMLRAIGAYVDAKRVEGRAESRIARYLLIRRAIEASPLVVISFAAVPTCDLGHSTPAACMIRVRLVDTLKRRGWLPSRLSQETGLTATTKHRLADPNLRFGRFTADTLDRPCRALDVQPGDLLEWVPAMKQGRRR